MVMPPASRVYAADAHPPRHPAFPQAALPAGPKNQSWPMSCAQTAIIPTNSVIDAKAAASSTKIRNIIVSLGLEYLEHRENNVPSLF
jgi:hypothetical protein